MTHAPGLITQLTKQRDGDHLADGGATHCHYGGRQEWGEVALPQEGGEAALPQSRAATKNLRGQERPGILAATFHTTFPERVLAPAT